MLQRPHDMQTDRQISFAGSINDAQSFRPTKNDISIVFFFNGKVFILLIANTPIKYLQNYNIKCYKHYSIQLLVC